MRLVLFPFYKGEVGAQRSYIEMMAELSVLLSAVDMRPRHLNCFFFLMEEHPHP